MQEEIPERPPTSNLIEALNVRRNAAFGFTMSIVFTALVYVYRVVLVGHVRGQAGTPTAYLALGFVLAFTLGALLTAALTLVSARRLARDLD
ncbi:hypothetical protein BG842_15735 [Haladaptatus sp. W1]|uniref:Uncharacterized protein n=1 Tax=Haladaptatus paucihalophilus DX253 TaxID=797209 RepID=A0A1M7BPS5_HALPU|nr:MULTISPECIES: hypothetical protein [Haladaptatus]ODR82872.1 hypothetical protein BG842_15735 [Haladaptatus sp. W1]GKZ14851.1 hypothetical protein HAL_27320 [Haladaptatus sp. T7]SHL57048.1 hypothetical protein SAMN05444342_4151 [Haladaptatus paucihalophilus DX253]